VGGNRNLARAANLRDLAGDEISSSRRSKSQFSQQPMTENELRTAAKGTKVIYFDSNGFMYTEEDVKSGKVGKKKGLSKMVVRVSEQERKRLIEVEGKQPTQRL